MRQRILVLSVAFTAVLAPFTTLSASKGSHTYLAKSISLPEGNDYPSFSESGFSAYIGGFLSNYFVNYAYRGSYSSSGSPNPIPISVQEFKSSVAQEGGSFGGQIGVERHFNSPYSIGVVFGIATNPDAPALSSHIEDLSSATGQSVDVTDEFRLHSNIDIAAKFGIDITPGTQGYFKLGVSRGQLFTDTVVTAASNLPEPIPFHQFKNIGNLWGLLTGVGFIYDVTKWVNLFAEYDYYAYGSHSLGAHDRIAPLITAAQSDALTQSVALNASAFRFGVNLDYSDIYQSIPYFERNTPWRAYLGLFTGSYTVGYQYDAIYRSSRPSNLVIADTLFQQATSFGGQAGFQYHFENPYSLGLVLSWMTNNNFSNFIQHFEDVLSAAFNLSFDLQNRIRIKNNIDLAAQLGMDLTERMQFYVKGGLSIADLSDRFSVTRANLFSQPIPSMDITENKRFLGWVAGLGFVYDLSRWFNVFAEYDYYGYGNRPLNTQTQITPSIPATVQDLYHQSVNPYANSVRVGLNFKPFDSALPIMRNLYQPSYWLLYIGGALGYALIDYLYQDIYYERGGIVSPGNEIFADDTFQEGVLFGGQAGVQFHFQRPYFIGVQVSDIGIGGHALLTNLIQNSISSGTQRPFDITHRIWIRKDLDLTAQFGIDVTRLTHAYFKLGVSDILLSDYTSVTNTQGFIVPIIGFMETQNRALWGWTAGLGAAYDLCPWVSLFAEYDYYDYGQLNLNSIYDINPFRAANAIDLLTRRVNVTASTLRAGLNLTVKI